jgi:FKBP12-rapamycin complex-associated protein
MLIKALEVSGIEGTFKLTCENVMRICRNNMDSLLAILKSFIHDPLISFRLMIPMIMKKNKMLHNINNSIRKNSNTEENQESKNNKIKEINDNIKNKEELEGKIIKDLKKNKASFIEDEKEKEEKEENNEINENNNVVYLEVEEKKQRKKMENESRQIFTLFEERDEIESEELNKIAQIVINRIKNKLSGTDFDKNIVYNYKEQVEKLIKQATSHENLAQSYLGWCPFW